MSETPKQADSTHIESHLNLTKKIFSQPVKAMVAFSSVLLIVIMLLMAADVILRFLFRRPIEGSDELVGLLLLCIAACAFSYTQLDKRHVRIELFFEHLPKKVQLFLNIFNFLLAFAIASLIAWRMFVAARMYILNLQGGSPVSDVLGLPWFPYLVIAGIGFSIFALVLLADLLMTFGKAVKR